MAVTMAVYVHAATAADDDIFDVVLGEGSERDGSGRGHSNNARVSSTSSSSSPSDSDSDALMVSQELRPGFSSDKDVRGRGIEDDTNEHDVYSEVLQQIDVAANSNGSVGVATE